MEGRKLQPTAVAEAIPDETRVGEASTAELLAVCIDRANVAREEALARVPETQAEIEERGAIAREFSLGITHLEDAITRLNKGVYRAKGTFGISDAERS